MGRYSVCFDIISPDLPFSSLFYSTGQPEIIALSELLRVHSVVWQVHQGYAEAIFQHRIQSPSPTTIAVHLHYDSGRHYEDTDIPKVCISILFLHSHS